MNIPIYSHIILIALVVLSFNQKEPTALESELLSKEIGKKIYTTGMGEGDFKIMAEISGRDIPASMMACINCHGDCGKGTTLQGVFIPDIRSEFIMERYGKNLDLRNLEKAINYRLKKVISLGVKVDGEYIHKMMPRYKMSIDDMDHLLAYLAILGTEEKCSID